MRGLVEYSPEVHADVLLWSVDESRKARVTWSDGLLAVFAFVRDGRAVGEVDPRYTVHWSSAVAMALLEVWGEAAWPVNDHLLTEGQGALDWPGAESGG